HALADAAGDIADDVEHVRPLAVDETAALGGIDLARKPRPLHPIVEVPAIDLDHPAEAPADDHPPHRLDRRVEDLGVALHELHAALLGRRDHRVALIERDRHRLFADHVL